MKFILFYIRVSTRVKYQINVVKKEAAKKNNILIREN